ncbi:hypothetical protein CVIRNUC_005877 [Coccomyxa viridis]|uniref:ABC1 atypical kinase-like domain-containing protein n=1 Tax=Coccomyxa viridis TaxID=1274662 RepID=A0AAV1I8Z6_9CHLO|nr:hypothetical protein CVIRNUC_005877 [Coccomyxa viridis]
MNCAERLASSGQAGPSHVCTGHWRPKNLRGPCQAHRKHRQGGQRCMAQASSISTMSGQFQDMRAQLESDEQLKILMAGLRGSNLNDSDYAEEGVNMVMVEVEVGADEDDLPLTYEPVRIAEFWSRRPVAVLTRVAQLLSIGGGFLTGVLWDLANGSFGRNEVKRAIQLRNIVTSLGPAYIKLGQALSIRPDILSPAAMNELQKLCDKVPSFNSGDAMQVIADELGAPWHEVYAELTPKPIAAASLGQVYKGRLKSGEQVAVKVQRPYVVETVSIDLFIIRSVGVFLRRFPQVRTDFPALIDEWASRFFEELDYIKEGNNGIRFSKFMAKELPQVVVPGTYMEYTSRRVLTSTWIEGEKLSQSKADNVAELVNVGVVAYLHQLLDIGWLMADPHPGNLIRTPDGRLAILDFGLMVEIDDDIKYGMIEAISHLIHRDYEAIVQDFITLRFIPRGTDLRPILPVLAKVFDQALEGGGAKNINFQELAADLAQITYSYPFEIPPYFALIIRAISVLEGIALVADPEFQIIQAAYPFISRKLLTDQSPRLKAALHYMIYGKESQFDAARLVDLLGAYESFKVASTSARGSMSSMDKLDSGSPTALPAGTAPGRYEPQGSAWPRGQHNGRTPQHAPGEHQASTSSPLAGFPDVPFMEVLPAPALGLLTSALAVPGIVLGSILETNALPDFSSSPSVPTGEHIQPSSVTSDAPKAREALKLLLSPEGQFFREFITSEVVLSIDAMSRTQLAALVDRLGLAGINLPILLPGTPRSWLPLRPELSEEDRRSVENVAVIMDFLTGSSGSAVMPEVAPLLPQVAGQMLPGIVARLTSRISARVLRDLYLSPAAEIH